METELQVGGITLKASEIRTVYIGRDLQIFKKDNASPLTIDAYLVIAKDGTNPFGEAERLESYEVDQLEAFAEKHGFLDRNGHFYLTDPQ